MIHPKHFVELDAIPEKFSRMGKFDGLRLNADMVNEDGFPTSIVVEIGGDEHAARYVADRIRRCWNAMRDVPDDQFGDVVVCSKKNEVDELIPPPETVKHRLGAALRETMLLRRLLRLSELKARFQPADQDARSKAQKREGRDE